MLYCTELFCNTQSGAFCHCGCCWLAGNALLVFKGPKGGNEESEKRAATNHSGGGGGGGRKEEKGERERERIGPLFVRRVTYFFNFNYVSTMKCLPE